MAEQKCTRCGRFARKRDRHEGPLNQEWCTACLQSWRRQTYSRTGRKLYVVAPFRHIYDNWCIDHKLNPRSNFLVAMLPTNPHGLRGLRGIDYTVAPYYNLVLDRTAWARLEALLNEMRNYVQGNSIDDVEAWLKENLA